ncbi:MAG: SlyX family protein [Gammaproteobacteria bacterium]|nr:SlyX family protein [Gammaproteobacteria bacterium]
MSDIENRIMELEIKSAHQEETIEQLNQIAIEQQKTVSELTRHMEQLKDKISILQESNSKDLPEPPPPHY